MPIAAAHLLNRPRLLAEHAHAGDAKTQKWLKNVVGALANANLDDLNTVPRGSLKRDAKVAFEKLHDDKRHPEAHIISVDGREAIAVVREKKNGDLLARLFDDKGHALLDKPVNLGKLDVKAGPDRFFMEGGSDVDLFLPRS